MKAHEKLRELMRRRNFSQEDLAQKAELSQSMISTYLRGESVTTMKVSIAVKLCEIFDVPIGWLFDERQPMRSQEEFAMEKQMVSLIEMMGVRAAIRRLAKIENGEENGGETSSRKPKPDFGPIGLSGSPGEPAPKSAQPRGGKSRRSNG